MSDDGAAVDELMVHTSILNQKLAEMHWPLITLPQRSAPIEPFFRDLIIVLDRLVLEVGDLRAQT